MEDQPPATILRLARSIRQRKGHPQPSRLGISLGEPSNASPVVAVGTTTTVTHTRKEQPTAPVPTTAATPPPSRPQRSLARRPVQRLVSAVSPTHAPTTPPLRPPKQEDTAVVTWALLPTGDKTSTPPGSASTPSAEPAPAPETSLTGEWMAERVTWSSEIQVQEGRIVHNAATPLRQALWSSVMLDMAAQTGMPPAKLLDEADRLFLAVEKCRGTRLRTLRSWHAPYKSKQPGVSAGARRVWHRPSARPAEQAPAVPAANHTVQRVAQPIPPVTPAHITVREPLTPLNALPRDGGEDGVDDEPVLPMRARRRMAGAHNSLSSTA